MFSGQSRILTACPGKITTSFRDAELSRMSNPVPILSGFECSVTSHVALDHFDGLIPISNSLSSDAFIRAKNAPNPLSAGALPRTPLGSLQRSPRLPSRLGRGHPVPLAPRPPLPVARTVSRISIVDLWSP